MAKTKKKTALYLIEVDRSGLPEEPYNFHARFSKDPTLAEVEAAIEAEDVGYNRDYCKATWRLVEDAELITDAEVIEETKLEKTDFKVILPEIPKKFFIEDKKTGELKEHSLAEVARIEKEADVLIAAIKGFDDAKGYALLEEKQKEALKQRTLLEAKRKEVTAPINSFAKSLKESTDAIWKAAEAVEAKIDKKLNEKAEHEAELERQRLEKIAERTKSRKLELVGLGGIVNPLNNVFSFDHNAGTIISPAQLDEFSDEEWSDTVSELKESFEADQKKKQEEKEAEEAKEKALKERTTKIRGKELALGGWAMGNGTWVKNGVKITNDDIENLSDEEWDERIADGDIAEVEFEDTSAPEQVTELPAESNPGTPVVDIPAPNSEPVTTSSEIQAKDTTAPVEADEGEKVSVVLNFTKEEPYKQFFVAGTSYMRVFPPQFEDQSTRDISKEQCVNVGSIDDKLFWIVYKFNK